MSARRNGRPTRRRPGTPGCRCQICRPADRYDELERRAVRTVREHGWHVMLVADDGHCGHPDHRHDEPADDGEPEPAFAYTVGLAHRVGHPELLVSGLDPALMHGVLNGVARRVLEGRRLRPGDVLEDVLPGVPVLVARASPAARRGVLLWAGWFHRRVPEALVVVWPTRSGLFPWQPGAPAVLGELQPPRWRAPLVVPEGVATDPPWPFPVPPEHGVFTCTHVAEDGAAVLWVARQRDPDRGEDWTIHCGGAGHDLDDSCIVHLAHLVRSAPSLREVADLGLDYEAERATTDAGWVASRLA